jgi:Mrp family chromosome partitioning ATPase
MSRMFDALTRTVNLKAVPSDYPFNVVSADDPLDETTPELDLFVPEVALTPPPTPHEIRESSEAPYIEVGFGVKNRLTNLPSEPLATATVPVSEPARKSTPSNTSGKEVSPTSVMYQPLPGPIGLHPDQAIKFSPDLLVYHQPEHSTAKQYVAVASMILSRPSTAVGKSPVYLFSGVFSDTGTTSVTLNVAIAMAKQDPRRTLIIDANPGTSTLAKRLGIPTAPGFHELLHRSLPRAVTIQRTGLPNLFAIPTGNGEGIHGVSDQPRLLQILQSLQSRYELILIDGPSWGDETLPIWAELANASFLVLKQTDSDRPEVEEAHDSISGAGGHLQGYILTRE